MEIATWSGAINVPRATPGTLDDFETWASFKLPPSYRDFVLRFGPGELARWFPILAPVGLKKAHQDLAAYHSGWLTETRRRDFTRWCDDPERMKRVVFFCHAFAADYFAWDPQDPSLTKAEEYRVHLHYKRGTDREVVADSFAGFVRDCCFTHAPVALPDYDPEDSWIKHAFVFEPQPLRGG